MVACDCVQNVLVAYRTRCEQKVCMVLKECLSEYPYETIPQSSARVLQHLSPGGKFGAVSMALSRDLAWEACVKVAQLGFAATCLS